MTDVVVTVPLRLWHEWLAEGDLPGERWSGQRSHFWIPRHNLPSIRPVERVYVVAHGKLRGYAPLVKMESSCSLRRGVACLMRFGGAVAVTLNCYEVAGCAHGGPEHPALVPGFRGWRYRDWPRHAEIPFPNWRDP